VSRKTSKDRVLPQLHFDARNLSGLLADFLNAPANNRPAVAVNYPPERLEGAYRGALDRMTDHARIVEVFHLSQQLTQVARREPSAGRAKYKGRAMREDPDRDARYLRSAINSCLADFLVRPVVDQGNSWSFTYARSSKPTPVGPVGSARLFQKIQLTPAAALKVLTILYEHRTLERMCQCEICSSWFFARTAKKKVCSNVCRKTKSRRRDPEYKKKARASAAKWRSRPEVKIRVKDRKRKRPV